MELGLHAIPKSLTVRTLVSPIVDVECSRDDLLERVLSRVRERLKERRPAPDHPVPRRASVIVGKPGAEVEFAVLDVALMNDSFEEFLIEDDERVWSISRTATSECIIDASTNFVTAMKILADLNHPPKDPEDRQLLVRDQGRNLGVLDTWALLESLQVRVAVFALLLELEEAVVDRVLEDGSGYWSALPRDRRRKMIDQARTKYPHIDHLCMTTPEIEWPSRLEPHRSVLAASNFCDKLTIMRKKKWCQGHLSGKLVDERNGRLEKVRNWCAHSSNGDSPVLLHELVDVIEGTQEMILELQFARHTH